MGKFIYFRIILYKKKIQVPEKCLWTLGKEGEKKTEKGKNILITGTRVCILKNLGANKEFFFK